MASNKATDSSAEEDKILEFLQKQKAPYSEPRLIEELFNMKLAEEKIPTTQDDLEKLIKIRNALRKLVEEKKVFAANLEDPYTKESVLHYFVEGWHATP